jgi:hypothetical protein
MRLKARFVLERLAFPSLKREGFLLLLHVLSRLHVALHVASVLVVPHWNAIPNSTHPGI